MIKAAIRHSELRGFLRALIRLGVPEVWVWGCKWLNKALRASYGVSLRLWLGMVEDQHV